jgi:transcriptional regulator of heat shock response
LERASTDLNHRSRRILSAVVSEYLHTGEAVGSRTITRRHGIELSPATVRNVMADLEDMGFIASPHTSAGRVPTPTGLRFFIDCRQGAQPVAQGKVTISASAAESIGSPSIAR